MSQAGVNVLAVSLKLLRFMLAYVNITNINLYVVHPPTVVNNMCSNDDGVRACVTCLMLMRHAWFPK